MMYKLQKKRLIILSSNGINWTLSIVAKDASNLALRVSLLRLQQKVYLFLYYLKKYKNYEHSSLELFYSVIYFIHKGGMTNVKRKNKISIKSISS